MTHKAPLTKTRFAPSPTGYLHLGNIRTAIHNYLWARKYSGQFLLRIDDTDRDRSKQEYIDHIRADLRWMGLEWSAEYQQSARFADYEAAFAQLRDCGRIYPCYETVEELEVRRKILLSQGRAPIYERKPADAKVPSDRTPHWRFRLDHDSPIAWEDAVRGAQYFDPRALSDPVIRRADGSWLYQLPSVVDDIAMEISHVVRGEDHVSNTATQIQIFAALGAPPPIFAHAALLIDKEGKLSKRMGSQGAGYFRELAIEPIALVALLARLGTSDPVEAIIDSDQLAAQIDFARFGRAPALYEEELLVRLNQKILHQLDYATVAERLPPAIDEAKWQALRPNLARLSDVEGWLFVFDSTRFDEELDNVAMVLEAEDSEVIDQASAMVSDIDWESDPWHVLTKAVGDATGAKGKRLFLPLRKALTARQSGPDMAALLPLIGKEETTRRLHRAADRLATLRR